MFVIRQNNRHAPARRRGITLIELLVVISIMTMVAAIAIPRMRPMMENRNIRESARAVNVFLSQARVRAMETGRPCGVLFQRDTDLNRPFACTVMRQIEIPPPYGGNSIGSVIRVQYGGAGVPLKAQVDMSDIPPDGLIRRGDTIQLDYQGPFYQIVDDRSDNSPSGDPSAPAGTADPGNDLPADANGFIQFSAGTDSGSPGDGWMDQWLSLASTSDSASPWATSGWQKVPFKIYRQPSYEGMVSNALGAKAFGSIAPSLQLPRGAVVDLHFSGVGTGTQFGESSPADATPVVVMFSPSGAVAGVVCSQAGQTPVTATVFLLVGRSDRADTTLLPDDDLNNWKDMNNFWLAISPQTGLVTAANPGTGATADDSRALAREAQMSKGGR